MNAASPPFAALAWSGDAGGVLRALDQTALPLEERWLELRTPADVVVALRRLSIRGAPLIGVAGAYAVHLGLRGAPDEAALFAAALDRICAEVAGARPTAVNLHWAVAAVRAAVDAAPDVPAKKRAAFARATAIQAADRTSCARMADVGAAIFGAHERVLTYCNTGALATAGEGTALGVILNAARLGKVRSVHACETRPLLQGARLTMWELARAGVDATLVCDNAAADLMRRGLIDRVLVGADRIAANGDAANKIGTYGVAVAAAFHGVPFHVVAPASTFDLATPDGAGIPIEMRDAEEVLSLGGVRTAPRGVKALSPAFDVTPAKLIASIVTDRGLIAPVDRARVAAVVG